MRVSAISRRSCYDARLIHWACRTDLESSRFWSEILDSLRATWTTFEACLVEDARGADSSGTLEMIDMDLVCYGIGAVQSSRKAQMQVALLVLLERFLRVRASGRSHYSICQLIRCHDAAIAIAIGDDRRNRTLLVLVEYPCSCSIRC